MVSKTFTTKSFDEKADLQLPTLLDSARMVLTSSKEASQPHWPGTADLNASFIGGALEGAFAQSLGGVRPPCPWGTRPRSLGESRLAWNFLLAAEEG